MKEPLGRILGQNDFCLQVNASRYEELANKYGFEDADISAVAREIFTFLTENGLDEPDQINEDGIRPVAFVALLDEDDHVLMLEPKVAVNDGRRNYNLLQGGIEEGESILAAALWELYEEMGIRPSDLELLGFETPSKIAKKAYHPVKFRLKGNQVAHMPEEKIAQYMYADPTSPGFGRVLDRTRTEKAELIRNVLAA